MRSQLNSIANSSHRGLTILVSLLVLTTAGTALGAEDDDCPLFFPDFRCDRQVRPEGSVMPMSMPYLFEDPYIQTGANFVGIWHEFPDDSMLEGGQVGVLALQLRVAITDRVAFIATKDGLSFWDMDAKFGTGTKLLGDETGFFNIAAGFKVKAWEWEGENQSAIVTPSFRYEIPVGNQNVFQGHDDGLLIPAVSAAYQHGFWHVIAGLGGQAPPTSDSKNSSLIFYNIHLDHAFETNYEAIPFVVPFVSLNGIHYTHSGDGNRKVDTKTSLGGALNSKARQLDNVPGTRGTEGVDVANLGSKNMAGEDIITMAWGIRLPLQYGLSLGASYERPLSNKKDIFEQRVTLMLTWEM